MPRVYSSQPGMKAGRVDFVAAAAAGSGRARDFTIGGGACGRRYGIAFLLQAVPVKLDGFSHIAVDFFLGAAGDDAAGQMGRIRRVACAGLVDDNEVLHGFSAGCLRMLLCVPGARGSPGLPATVTRPDLAGCWNGRWRRRVGASRHPSCSARAIISLTFRQG